MHSNGAGGDSFRRGLLPALPIVSSIFWLILDPSSPYFILLMMADSRILEIDPSSLSFILITMTGDRILETSSWCSWGLTNGASRRSIGGAGWNKIFDNYAFN